MAWSQGISLDDLRRLATTRQTSLLHANVNWSYGPLRYVVPSPMFHRWHHPTEAEGLETNFAGLFPVIDLAFGTFFMPAGRQPQRFGIMGRSVPMVFSPSWYIRSVNRSKGSADR